MSALFELSRVSCRYREVTALDALDLKIDVGTRVALVGANGSGKSTLLRVLDALEFPEAGQVQFRGAPLTPAALRDERQAHAFRRAVGLVFQNPDAQLFNPTVFDEVAFGPLQLGWARSEIRDRVDQALARLRIGALRDRMPHRLSGGEKKKVALASVLVLDPDVLLLDEPTAALDPRSQSEVIDFLADWGRGPRTVVVATHDLGHLEDVADRCCVLEAGRLVADRAPADVLADHPLLERTNLVHAHRHRHADGAPPHAHFHLHRS